MYVSACLLVYSILHYNHAQVDERLVELISKSSSSEALKLIFVSSNQDNIKSTVRSMVDVSQFLYRYYIAGKINVCWCN